MARTWKRRDIKDERLERRLAILSISTNSTSKIAQRSLKNSTKELNKTVERMSTGYKINHASDNAANCSISKNMTTKLGGYKVAEDNTAMGLDLITTASESLDLINDKLVRLRALAEQAANGTYGEQSLEAINAEANALVDEIQRRHKNAEYNGINLFGKTDVNKTGGNFIEKVTIRDTSKMKKLADVDSNSILESGSYSISTAEELAKLSQMSKYRKLSNNTEFVLNDNIDLSKYSSGEGWETIDWGRQDIHLEFDGNGYVISNLYINHTDGYNSIGLFQG